MEFEPIDVAKLILSRPGLWVTNVPPGALSFLNVLKYLYIRLMVSEVLDLTSKLENVSLM